MDIFADAKAAASGKGKNAQGATLLQFITQAQADMWQERLEDDGYHAESSELAPRVVTVW